jgi:hypothetical protein
VPRFKRDHKHPLARQDLCTRSGADAIVRHLTDYWTTRGYSGIRVEKYELPGTTGGSWGVRSNMVGGVPPAKGART